MPETYSKLYALLMKEMLPQLTAMETRQIEQKQQLESMNQAIHELRAEMHLHFAEIRADVALCRQELEDTMVVLRESGAIEEDAEMPAATKRVVQ
jgi:hypothetical protein